MQLSGQRFGELKIAHRMGGNGIHGAKDGWLFGSVHEQTGQIGHVNPRHPLPTVAEWTAAAEFERSEHLGKRAASAAQDDASARRHNTHTE